MKRVDDVWLPVSMKEDPVSAGRRSLRHDEQEFSCAYSMALSVPRPVMGWADAACAPAAEKVNPASSSRNGRCRNAHRRGMGEIAKTVPSLARFSRPVRFPWCRLIDQRDIYNLFEISLEPRLFVLLQLQLFVVKD
jgi:hypothetical protein